MLASSLVEYSLLTAVFDLRPGLSVSGCLLEDERILFKLLQSCEFFCDVKPKEDVQMLLARGHRFGLELIQLFHHN
jgi:hypothetical protein